MSILKNQNDSKSGILLDTQYAVEELNLTWRIANFSQIFDTVHTQFSLKNSSTLWQLRLIDKRYIYLRRCDLGEPVNVELRYSLVTHYHTFQGEKFLKFLGKSADLTILNLDVYEGKCDDPKNPKKILIEFKDDILEFYCTIKIVGPSITKTVKLNDFIKSNLVNLSDDLKRLLNNRDHCDVTIVTGSKKLPVHKAILCARSKVFNRMFQINMLESKNQLIELDDIDFDTIEGFITFLYTGEVKMSSVDKVMNLYYVADKYEVEDLRQNCSLYLEYNLSVDEACTILKFADMHRDDKLKNAVAFYIQMHASVIKLSDGWKELVKNHPKLALETLK